MTHDLIDARQMYLRTILELEEEGVTPLRARIAGRLHQAGPTVSQTVARMERDGLVVVTEFDRRLALADEGRGQATAVMRKHRLAEVLLINVIGMPYEQAHDEACRWEHVMGEALERRVYDMLERPTRSPYGNPIPGLEALDSNGVRAGDSSGDGCIEYTLTSPELGRKVVIRRISESVQADIVILRQLHAAGIDPGRTVCVVREASGVTVQAGGDPVRLLHEVASRVFVASG